MPRDPDVPDYPDPPRRRRTALIVVAVLGVVAAGVGLGLVINSRDDGQDASGLVVIDPNPIEPPRVELLPGCELLTPGQVGSLVPGTPTKIGRGPGPVLDATESACEWANTETDPNDPRVQPAALEVKATATTDVAAARTTMEISLPCQEAGSRKTTVTGAEEACLAHTTDGQAEVAVVSARFQTLVVEVSYQRANWPAWRVEDQTAVTAAALIGRVARSQ